MPEADWTWFLDMARQVARRDRAWRSVAVPVRLSIGHARALKEGDPLVGELQERVARVVQDHLTALGLPGLAEVQAVPQQADHDDAFLLVNGHPCRTAHGDLEPLIADVTGGAAKRLADVPDQMLAEVVAAVCTEALQRRLSVLAGPEQMNLLLRAAGVAAGAPEATSAAAIRRVLDHGTSVEDQHVLADVLKPDGQQLPAEVAEVLLDRLRPRSVEILLNIDTLRRVTTAQPEGMGIFPALRERIFEDRGVQLPDFHMRIAERVPTDACAFRLNHVTTRPRRIPATDPLSHLAALLDEELRRHASWFVSMTDLQESRGHLELVFPDCVGEAKERFPLPWLSAVMRCLVEESVSIRDLITLLDWLLDLDDPGTRPDTVRFREGPRAASDAHPGAALPEPRAVVAFVRQRKREVAWAIAPGDEAQPVHRLDRSLEELAPGGRDEQGGEPAERSQAQRLLAAVRAMVEAGPSGTPLLVSSVPSRSRVRDALTAEFPELAVVASQEYPPWVRLVSPPSPDHR